MSRAMIIINGQADRDKAARWAQGVPVGSRIEFKETKRSLPQNDRFWAMLTDIAAHMKKQGRDHTTEQWKVIFMAAFGHEVKFLPTLDQKSFIPLGHSSSDLSVKEMTDLIEFMLAWGAENGVVFNDNTTSANSAPAPKDGLPDTGEVSPALPVEDGGESGSLSSGAPPSSDDQPDMLEASPEWLVTAARMLWAATNVNGNVDDNLDLLNNQRRAIEVPANASQTQKDKAGSIYRRCKAVVMREEDPADTRSIIAGIAGCSEDEVMGVAK